VAGGLAVGRCVAWVGVLSSVIPVSGWVVCPPQEILAGGWAIADVFELGGVS
jgi:hypothetical protein